MLYYTALYYEHKKTLIKAKNKNDIKYNNPLINLNLDVWLNNK